MKPEIKFRAWHGVYGGMTYFKLSEGSCCGAQGFNPQDRPVIMQFMGLKDKNGKEIYEGDIVTVDGTPYLIEWRGAGDWFVGTDNDCFMFTPEVYSLEIVGNIHENPNLFRGEK